MRKIALVAVLAVSAVSAVAYAQARCGSDLCMGSDATQVRTKGVLQLDKGVSANDTTQAGTCTLSSASPSTCTATVRAGSKCVCAPVGATAAIAAAGCAVGVSSTTLTITGPNTVTTVMNYWCF